MPGALYTTSPLLPNSPASNGEVVNLLCFFQGHSLYRLGSRHLPLLRGVRLGPWMLDFVAGVGLGQQRCALQNAFESSPKNHAKLQALRVRLSTSEVQYFKILCEARFAEGPVSGAIKFKAGEKVVLVHLRVLVMHTLIVRFFVFMMLALLFFIAFCIAIHYQCHDCDVYPCYR